MSLTAKQLDEDVRRSFCKSVARYLHSLKINIVPSNDILSAIIQWYETSGVIDIDLVRSHLATFLADAQLSMLLIRDTVKDGFKFSHAAFQSFFLAQTFIDEIKLLGDGATHSESYSRFCKQKENSTLSTVKLTPPRAVEALFTLGGLEAHREAPSAVLRRAIDAIRGQNHNPTLAANLVALYVKSVATDDSISLNGLNLAGTDFRNLAWPQINGVRAQSVECNFRSSNANLEFTIPSHKDEKII